MNKFLISAALLTLVFSAGCRSAYIEATVHNATGGPLTLLEVDYPSASFGKDELAAGADFHYRFKILGNGGTKVLWTDAKHQEHSTPGPQLAEGEQGDITIAIAETAQWQVNLRPSR